MLHDTEGADPGAAAVAASVLLDPVTFLLCDPTVATMVVYKEPTSAIDFLMHFFLSRYASAPHRYTLPHMSHLLLHN